MCESGNGKSVRAIHCIDHGPPVRLETTDVARPRLPEGHVRVAVRYCGLGVPDMLIMKGAYQVRPPLPFVPGSEVAGIVTEVAPDVTDVRRGARVAGLNYTFTGGLGEETVMPVAAMVEVPEALSLRVASAMPVNYATAYYALKDRGSVCSGETVLVLGAAGGVGLASVEVAKALGARVVAAASSEEKLALARSHGADDLVDYSGGLLKDDLKRYGGIDVIVDPVGGVYSEQALRALRPGGRLLVVGFAAGEIPRIALNLPLLKDCSITGAYLASQTRERPERFVANMKELFRLHLEGQLSPTIKEFDCFLDCRTALDWIEDRRAVGKVVMRVGAGVEGAAEADSAADNRSEEAATTA